MYKYIWNDIDLDLCERWIFVVFCMTFCVCGCETSFLIHYQPHTIPIRAHKNVYERDEKNNTKETCRKDRHCLRANEMYEKLTTIFYRTLYFNYHNIHNIKHRYDDRSSLFFWLLSKVLLFLCCFFFMFRYLTMRWHQSFRHFWFKLHDKKREIIVL